MYNKNTMKWKKFYYEKKNFCYEKMIRKMYVNLQEKYKNSVFQILKIWIAFRNFDFHLAIRKKNTLGRVAVSK